MSHTLPINCNVCQCQVELDPSLCLPSDDEKSSGDCLSDLAARLRDNLDMTQSGGNLLDIFCNSSNPLQFPLCKKCYISLSKELNKQLGDLEAECVCYENELSKLEASESSPDQIAAKRRLDDLEREEKELIEELKRVDAEEKALQKELELKVKERSETKDTELYKKLRDNHRKLIEQSEENRGLRAQQKYLEEQLNWLSKTQVLDMTFYIWMHGDYGTINGLRLGRLRHELVEWNEINAALGQIALLLKVLAERINFVFDGYEIYPCGSHSFFRTARDTELTFYGNGGWRPFGQLQLDQALVAYMECFCQLEAKLRSYFNQGSQILPYRMTRDMIIDNNSPYSVKMQLNSEERWTKAMKCLLANLKRTIAIMANMNNSYAFPSSNPFTNLSHKDTSYISQMTEVGRNCSIGSESSGSDDYLCSPRDAELSKHMIRQKRKQKEIKLMTNHPRVSDQTSNSLPADRQCAKAADVDEKDCKKDDSDESSTHSLMILNAKKTVERLFNLLSDLRRSCGLPKISDVKASNAEGGCARADQANIKDYEHRRWRTTICERGNKFRKMKYFNENAAKNLFAQKTETKALAGQPTFASYFIVFMAIVILCSRSTLPNKRPYLRTMNDNPPKLRSDFFSSFRSKLRWRGDFELLEFALGKKSFHSIADHYSNQNFRVDALLTESPPNLQQNTSSSTSSVADPSPFDYDAIDVSWRRDIEQEKNPWYSTIQPIQSNFASNEQFERDLQLLTEKSMTVQLDSSEQRHYENLSKSYYTNFYVNRGKAQSDKENQDALDFPPYISDRASSSSTRFPSTHLFPSTSKGYPTLHENVATVSPYNWQGPSQRENSVEEKTRIAVERISFPPDESTSDNNSEILLNDVSLSEASFQRLTGNVTEFFNFNDKNINENVSDSTLGNDDPSNDVNEEPLLSTFENLFDENIFDEGFIESNFGVDSSTFDELASEVMREDPYQDERLPEIAEESLSNVNPTLSSAVDDVDQMRYESTGTPSSGINSALASSPSYISSHEEFSMQSSDGTDFRFYNKLAPSISPVNFEGTSSEYAYIGDHDYYNNLPSSSIHLQNNEGNGAPAVRRGRRSKDENLAAEYNLPATAEEITRMTHTQIQHILRNPQFSAAQKALIKKIRRRGRNKVAARKCRERRLNPTQFNSNQQTRQRSISEFSTLQTPTSLHLTTMPTRSSIYPASATYLHDSRYFEKDDELYLNGDDDLLSFDYTNRYNSHSNNRRYFS